MDKSESKILNNQANYVNFELRNYPLGVYLFIINDGSQTKTLKYLNY